MVIRELFDEAINKAGSQQALAEKIGLTQQRVSTFKNYKGKGLKPSDTLLAELAIFVGRNPIDTVLACKPETEGKEKASLWLDWLNKWHPVGDSNPCYRRERAGS